MSRLPPRTPWRRPGVRAPLGVRLARAAAALLLVLPLVASAQSDDLQDIFGGIGTAEVDDGQGDLAEDLAPNEGTIAGQVIDAESGVPVAGATVILMFPTPADGSEPRQEVQLTGAGGEFRFARVVEGDYRLDFIKSGYRLSRLASFSVLPGQVNIADFPLPPKVTAAASNIMNLDAFVVEADMVGDMMQGLELRMESDAVVDVLGAEDLSKFAASNVADALKRVSGVNVVEGRFAVIRGLEDRYSSTLFNGAVIPSADPLRQSVQLDLFPSDIVSGIVVQKTFEAPSPGNSGAGSIDIGTQGYPDELTIKLNAGTGFNENAIDEFLHYRPNSPIGKHLDDFGNGTIESDLSASIGGRFERWEREFRYKAVIAREIDYDSAIGVIEAREPRVADALIIRGEVRRVRQTGGLAFKRLDVSDGRFDWTLSGRTEQRTFFGALGMDIDRDGDHRIDFTAFHTENDIRAVDRRDNGFIPGFDYAGTPLNRFLQPTLYGATEPDAFATVGSLLNEFRTEPEKPREGPLSTLPIVRGQSIVQDRELSVYQLNGEHELDDLIERLEFEWAANYASTKQDEEGFRMRYWYEPYSFQELSQIPFAPPFPPQVTDYLAEGPGSWRTSNNDIVFFDNKIDEQQGFGRGDFTYEFDPTRWMAAKAGTGFWYENSNRKLTFNEYLISNPIAGLPGVVNGEFVEGPTEDQLGPNAYFGYSLNDLGTPAVSDFKREIIAGYFDLKLTVFDDVDVIGGVRLEQIKIVSDNRPFTGACQAPIAVGGTARDESKTGLGCPPGFLPRIFPSRYLFLDRLDNRNNPFFRENPNFIATGVFADQLLNIQLPTDSNGFVDLLTPEDVLDSLQGNIDELKVFPMASVAYRPIEGMTLRAAYSETSSRPSFRELAYFASIVPGVPDRIVGNPFLTLSDVRSIDARLEYFWGDFGELLAFSVFYKTIQNPIELVVLRDFSVANFPLFEGPFRVYRNNDNQADLTGVELESRVSLGLMEHIGDRGRLGKWKSWSSFLQYFSIGGNFTYIDASVARSAFEIRSAQEYFLATPEDAPYVLATGLAPKRRLFNQPEWTGNADITFDHEDWGTKFTLSVFAISDVLNAAGAPDLGPNGRPDGYVLDEFVASFYQLDMVLSQSFDIPGTPGTWTARVSVKNLTDTERGILYDREATIQEYRQRTFTVGRDYSFSLQYQLTF